MEEGRGKGPERSGQGGGGKPGPQGQGNGGGGRNGRRFGRRRFGRGGPRPEGARGDPRADPRVEPRGEPRDESIPAEAQTPGEERPALRQAETAQAGEAERAGEGRARSEPSLCPLCGKPVFDLSTAVCADKETGVPAHFDCALERVAAAETLAAGEKLVYIGSGAFAVVEYRDKTETAFTVKRRVQWEKEGDKKEWRRGLSSRITRI